VISYYCTACERDDFPETEQFGIDATVRDHLRIWHSDEWAHVERIVDRLVITPTGEKRHIDGADGT
jgi:hypothetical protein